MQNLFNFFSHRSWLIIPKNLFISFSNDLNLDLIRENITWKTIDEINISNSLSKLSTIDLLDMYIVEGECINFIDKEKLLFLSNNSYIYKFNIDIWIPTMLFEHFKNNQLLRRYELDIQNEYIVSTDEIGVKTDIENYDETFIQADNGYDIFYYPLGVVSNLLQCKIIELKKILSFPCSLYKIPFEKVSELKDKYLMNLKKYTLSAKD